MKNDPNSEDTASVKRILKSTNNWKMERFVNPFWHNQKQKEPTLIYRINSIRGNKDIRSHLLLAISTPQ